MSIQPILVATDFSQDSDAALIWASNQAALTGAQLIVLHVVHDPAEAAGFYRREQGEDPEPITDIAKRMMAKSLSEERETHADLTALQEAKPMIVSGLPPGRIVEIAKHEDAQLVVIGSRGRTGLAHILVGSVAERVAQLAPMPVVIVKRKARG